MELKRVGLYLGLVHGLSSQEITEDGMVGIGKSDPSASLDVDGNIRAQSI